MQFKRWYLQDQAGDGDGSDVALKEAPAVDDKGGDKSKATPQIWADDWRQKMAGDDPAALKQLERYQSPTDIYKKARSLEQRLSSGELKSALPKDPTPEALVAWRAENGIPEKPEAYDVKGILSEEDAPTVQGYLAQMHSVNASPAVVKAGLEWYAKEVERLNDEAAVRDREFAKQSEDALRAEWGSEYRLNVNKINGLLETAPAAVRDEIMHGRLANGDPFMAHPEVMKWLNGMARQINPVTTIIPGAGANIGNAIEDEIKTIEKVMATDRKAYNEDEKMQSRLRELYDARDRLKK